MAQRHRGGAIAGSWIDVRRRENELYLVTADEIDSNGDVQYISI